MVAGQNIWNATQVGFLFLLLCQWRVRRSWTFRSFFALSVIGLPFALYLGSPGAWFCMALTLIACVMARKAPDLAIDVVDAPRGTSPFVKFAFLAFLCNLGSSIYNFAASQQLWPYWSSIFDHIARYVGFTSDIGTIARTMYTLGLDGIDMPASILIGSDAGNLGSLVFANIWTVLPTLYVLYFLAMIKLAVDSPGTTIQRALCLYGIVHFLFLTDFVDYRYGRGFANHATHWLHWNEVFVWRIAILLPVYQKLATHMWKEGNGTVGVVIHYALLFWAIGFFVHEVLLLDIPRFYSFATGQEFEMIRLFGIRPKELGYNGALVLMLFVYGFTAAFLRCKSFRLSVRDYRT